MPSPVVANIIAKQEANAKAQAEIKAAYLADDETVFQNLLIAGGDDQAFLSNVFYVLRELHIPQLSNYQIQKQLTSHYLTCVVYFVKGWYLVVNDLYPGILSSFSKQDFKKK